MYSPQISVAELCAPVLTILIDVICNIPHTGDFFFFFTAGVLFYRSILHSCIDTFTSVNDLGIYFNYLVFYPQVTSCYFSHCGLGLFSLWSVVPSSCHFSPPSHPPPFAPTLLKSRLPAIKVKYLLLAWLGILIASWVIYMQYASYSELCRGHVCHMVIVSISRNAMTANFITSSVCWWPGCYRKPGVRNLGCCITMPSNSAVQPAAIMPPQLLIYTNVVKY